MFFPLRDDNPRQTAPVLTIAVIAVNLIVWFYELSLGPDFLQQFFFQAGAVPGHITGTAPLDPLLEPLPGPATMVTSMFLHGGWMHVLSNMWFLWIFGDNVEDYFGKIFFPIFYIVSGLAATALHIAIEPASTVPVVGASGAISGILGAYAVLYPRARVYTYVWIIIFIRTFYLPAYLFLGIWFLFQFLSMGQGGVAWWAHIGGFVAGTGIALAARMGGRRPVDPSVGYYP